MMTKKGVMIEMKKIYVVNKTHLDIGFTDLAENVLHKYCHEYIQNAITLAEDLRKEGKNFVWTTGSFIIEYYFKNMDEEACQKLDDAIKKGYIRWHAIPCTFHSEAMTSQTLHYIISISKKLDARYGYTTTSAKMTDVPGHTIGIVDELYRQGVKFLHIGVNGSSSIPEVPDTFLWKHGESEIIVSYSDDYGGVIGVDCMDNKLAFMHTHDNSGPGTKEKINAYLSKMANEYPDYELEMTSMDQFANELWEVRDQLPVITEEIGDTWIHGTMSDPKIIRDYRILTNYMNDHQIENDDANFYAMLVPEHTWGMDIKRYFSDYMNYEKKDFQRARSVDQITDADLTYAYGIVKDATVGEMKFTYNEWTDRSYKFYESSWKEQRKNIDRAIACLEPEDQLNIKKLIEVPYHIFENQGIECGLEELISINGYQVMFASDGSITHLEKDGILYFDQDNKLGVLSYTIAGQNDYDNLRYNYLRELQHNWWAIDFLKPGMEIQKRIQLHEHFTPHVIKLVKENDSIIATLKYSQRAVEEYGAPRVVKVKYQFGDKVEIALLLKDKDAIRYPEIYSFDMTPRLNSPYLTKIRKMDTVISPFAVVGHGNKLQHMIEELIYDGSDKKINIKPIDAPLLGIGTNNNLSYNNKYHPDNHKFTFTLLNTTWGTNFTMWYEEDIFARFELVLG